MFSSEASYYRVYFHLEDEIRVSKQGCRQFLKHYNFYNTIARKPGSGLPPKLPPAVQQLIEDAMREDDETNFGSVPNLRFFGYDRAK